DAARFRRQPESARELRDPRQRAREFGQVLQQWIAQDPETALAYVRGLPAASAEYTQGILMVLEGIGRTDIDRALALAGELASNHEQLAIYSVLFARLGERDVAAGIQRLAALPPGEARENGIRALTEAWTRT